MHSAISSLGDPTRPEDVWCRTNRATILKSIAIGNVGAGLLDLGRAARALPYFEGQLDAANQIASPLLQARALANIGLCRLVMGDAPEAETVLRQGISVARPIDPITSSQILAWLSCTELLTQRARAAAATCAEAITLSAEVYPANIDLCLLIAEAIAVEVDAKETAALMAATNAHAETALGPVEAQLLGGYHERARRQLIDLPNPEEANEGIDVAVAEVTALLAGLSADLATE